MGGLTTIGNAPFSREDMRGSLDEFSRLYDTRPIKHNAGGMSSPHMFLAWFMLRMLRPAAVVESGIWRGQGTWLIEQACPEARLYCIDIDLSNRRYKSERAEYFDRDFSMIDWTGLPKDETLLFFDDHQNGYERVKTAKWFGFKHMIFEDNYPAFEGDCYSLKKAFAHAGLRFDLVRSDSPKLKYKQLKRKMLVRIGRMEEVAPNDIDAKYLRQNLSVYCELPPVFKVERMRFGTAWDDENFPTPEPLLQSVEQDYQRRFLDEAASYTWMCYARLK